MKKSILAGVFIMLLSLAGVLIYKANLCPDKDVPCQNKDKEEWRELPCGLWINKTGDIGLKTTASIMEKGAFDFYVTKTPLGDDIPLKLLVDTATFYYMGGSFYKDKNHIYNFFPMSGGGSFYPMDDMVDYSTFEVLGDGCFARDKNRIYVEKHVKIVEGIDYQTFQVIEGCLAHDKNGFILWTDRITENEAKEYLEND